MEIDGKNEEMIDPISSPIFYSKEVQPDTLLRVFDQEFHVHSTVLKIYSAFFRKFLNSREKESPTSSESGFIYKWVTEADEDGTGWSLVSTSGPSGRSTVCETTHRFSGDKKIQVSAFKMLLESLYQCLLDIVSPDQLILATKLADYYRVLPVLSKAIDRPLRNHWIQMATISGQGSGFLEAAYKLRNKPLFHDCMIYAMGPWDEPTWKLITDTGLRQVAGEFYSKQCEEVRKVQGQLWNLITFGRDKKSIKFRMEEKRAYKSHLEMRVQSGLSSEPSLPRIFRLLYEDQSIAEEFRLCFQNILNNELQLDNESVSGKDDFEDYFLSTVMSYYEFPWDDNETDW